MPGGSSLPPSVGSLFFRSPSRHRARPGELKMNMQDGVSAFVQRIFWKKAFSFKLVREPRAYSYETSIECVCETFLDTEKYFFKQSLSAVLLL